jgi:hypothetical protein
MSRVLLLFLMIATALFSSPLQERIERSCPGDYLVVEGGKIITIVSIRSVSPTSIILEEVSILSQNLKKHPPSWRDWIKERAPGHTSWSMIELDRKTGEVLECYSFTKASWIKLSSHESLLATLIKLPLTLVPNERRRKIGPPPMGGELDTRKIWEPPTFFEGKKQGGLHFDVFEAAWPSDNSPLSGSNVLLYFDREELFPLPFWIQVETAHAQIAIRTIDSGREFPSPYRKIPRRVPEFVGEPKKIKNGLRLFLKSPKYFRDFDLFAVDVTTRDKELCPITHSLIFGKEEFLSLEITEEELNQSLKPNHRYTWLLVPSGHGESYTESTKPFTWEPSLP